MKLITSAITVFVNIATTCLLISTVNAADISKPYTFTNGTTADASQVNANFDTVYSQTNVNTNNIVALINNTSNAITEIYSRVVSSGYAYHSDSTYTSEVSSTACDAGEIITGGTCTCNHTNFNTSTTNFGILMFCQIVGKTVIGACTTDSAVTYTYKYGPPITTTAICMSIKRQGNITTTSKSVAKIPEDQNSVDSSQAEMQNVIDKLMKEQQEYNLMRQDTNSRQ